jgi:hypothetical protein
MFVNGSGQMCNLYNRPSIDASYQVSVHLAKGFQRRRLKCEKLTDDRQRMPGDGKSSYCLWLNIICLKSASWNFIWNLERKQNSNLDLNFRHYSTRIFETARPTCITNLLEYFQQEFYWEILWKQHIQIRLKMNQCLSRAYITHLINRDNERKKSEILHQTWP